MVVGRWKRGVRPRILVVYGEHEESRHEVFSANAVRTLVRENFDNARFEKYIGEPESERQLWKEPGPKYRAFVKRFLPFDYTIDVHDTPYNEDELMSKGAIYPDFPFYFRYASRRTPNPRLQKDLVGLSRNYAVRGVFPATPYRWVSPNASKQYDYILVEFYPLNITKESATNFLRETIRILSKYKRTS